MTKTLVQGYICLHAVSIVSRLADAAKPFFAVVVKLQALQGQSTRFNVN